MIKQTPHLFAALLLSATACQPGQETYPAKPVTNMPLAMTSCAINECKKGKQGIWSFSGAQGQVEAPYGASGHLTVDRFDDGGVVIRQIDGGLGPNMHGLNALFKGTLQGTEIHGTVTLNYNGKTWSGPWLALIPPTLSKQQNLLSAAREVNAEAKAQAASGDHTVMMQPNTEAENQFILGLLGAVSMMSGDGGGGHQGSDDSGYRDIQRRTRENDERIQEQNRQNSGPYYGN